MKIVPPKHQWCNACDDGVGYMDGPETCDVCHGKGFWNAEDILQYHTLYPEVCQRSCGEKHIPPYLPTVEQAAEDRKFRECWQAERARLETILKSIPK